MDTDIERKIMDLAREAMEMDPSQRSAWLASACGANARLLTEVKDLLDILEETHQKSILGDLATLSRMAEAETLLAEESTWWRNKMIGSYQILSLLGEGGMGWVFLAQQTAPVTRLVALKMLKYRATTEESSDGDMLFPRYMGFTVDQTIDSGDFSDLDGGSGEMAARTSTEPQIMAMLSHPNIAQVYEVGRTPDGFIFFSMEYVLGENVTDYCREHRLPLEARLALMIQVCQGVHHAHLKGVLHLDLKPSNILVCEVDGRPVPKIIDFGIARPTANPTNDQAGSSPMGTPLYMSPEATTSGTGELDMRADVYALGVILYEIISGFTLLEVKGLTPAALMANLASNAIVPPSDRVSKANVAQRAALAKSFAIKPKTLARRLGDDLDRITLKAIARDRELRYESAADLAEDLSNYLRHLPVSAVPETRLYHFRKFIRRNLIAVSMACIIFLVMCGGIAARTLEARRANAEAARANRALAETQQVFRFLVDLINRADPDLSHDKAKADYNPGVPWRVDSEKEIRHGLALLKQELPPNHPILHRALNRLAIAQMTAGEYQKAVKTLKKAIKIEMIRSKNGDQDNNRSRLLLSQTYLALGQLEDAEAQLNHIDANLRRQRPPPPHTDFLDTLGDLYTREEKYDLALMTLDEAMQILENRWGFDHFDFSETLQRLAALYAAMGLAGQAEEAYRRVLAIHAHTPFRPEQATERVALLRNLGLFYLDQANNQKAAKYLESAWQKCREGLPPDSQAYRDTMAAYEKLTQPKGF